MEGHDFEGPRASKAHIDTVLTKPVTPPAPLPYIADLGARKPIDIEFPGERVTRGY